MYHSLLVPRELLASEPLQRPRPKRDHYHLLSRTISLHSSKPSCCASYSACFICLFCLLRFCCKAAPPAEDARSRVSCLLACLPHPCRDKLRLRANKHRPVSCPPPFACLSAPVGLHLSSITSQEDLDQRRPGYRSLQSNKPSQEQHIRLHIDNHAIQGATAPDALPHRRARGSVSDFGSYSIRGG